MLHLSDDMVLGNVSGRYKKDNTANAIYNLIKSCPDVDAVSLIELCNMKLSILVSSNNHIYSIRCERERASDYKSLNQYMHKFVKQSVNIRQIDDNSYTWL